MNSTEGEEYMDSLGLLRDAIEKSGLLADLQTKDWFVVGSAWMPTAGLSIHLNVDSELDDRPDETSRMRTSTTSGKV